MLGPAPRTKVLAAVGALAVLAGSLGLGVLVFGGGDDAPAGFLSATTTPTAEAAPVSSVLTPSPQATAKPALSRPPTATPTLSPTPPPTLQPTPAPAAIPVPTPPSKVYLTLVSHNESLFNEPCNRILDGNTLIQQSKYIANRTAVVQAARMVMAAGAAWDFQSDWRYLERVATYDTGSVTEDTDNKNLIQWLSEVAPGTLTVDAHSHEHGGYNLADVAKQIIDLGGPDNGIVGGFIATPPEDANWERFREPLVALQSSYEFQARTLWGGGSDMHVDDPHASGVWRPKDAEHFLEDAPSGTLPNIGNYTSEKLEATGVQSLLEMLRAGELEEGRMYTVAVMIRQCDLDLEGELEQLQNVLDTLAPEVETGDLIWATLPDVLTTWQETYGATAVVLPVEE